LESVIKLSGVPEDVLELLISKGYFKTKTEAIRAGVLSLGKEYKVLKSPEELELDLVALKIAKEEAEMKASGRKYISEGEVKKKYGFK